MSTTYVLDDPIEKFAISIFQINGALMRNGDRITKSIGQSSARWQVLGRASYTPSTVAQMAKDMGLTRQSVQRVANVLAKEGLIIYKNNPMDKRARLVELTQLGREILNKIYALNEKWSHEIMSQLDMHQLVEVTTRLEEIFQVLEADTQANKNK